MNEMQQAAHYYETGTWKSQIWNKAISKNLINPRDLNKGLE